MLVNQVSYRHSFVSGEGYIEYTVDLPSQLLTNWTPELQQDLQIYYNIDVEQELTNLLTEQLAREIDNQILSDIRQQTINRWEETGLLNGIDNNDTRQNIAELYESQAAQLLREQDDDIPVVNMNLEHHLVETQIRPLRFTDDETDVDTPIFPMVRRVMSHLLANELVEAQPMEQPMGRLVYMTPNPVNETLTYQWLTKGESWTYGSLYTSNIGIIMDLKPLKFK